MNISMNALTDRARYSEVLDLLLESMGGAQEVLRLSYESDYQGYVDSDILLNNGQIMSYKYWYGSCSGCDDWEARNLSDDEIAAGMKQEATFFDTIEDYRLFANQMAKGVS